MQLDLPEGVILSPGRPLRLGTRSLCPGFRWFGEDILKRAGGEVRVWDPTRSKLAAAIIKGIAHPGIAPGQVVLYLGASHGYTVSFVSDIVGKQGLVFAVDVAPRVVRDLVLMSKQRPNIAPILADAAQPASFRGRVCQADWLFQDIAQRDQAGIFLKNVHLFLKPGGLACLALKARSVDVAKRPREVFAAVKSTLEKEVMIKEWMEMDPLQKDHAFFVIEKPAKQQG